MPNKENIRAWVEALRSGKYRKGIGSLRQVRANGDTTFCCLGVACDVFGFDWDVSVMRSEMATLPKEVADWLHLRFDPMLRRRGGGHYDYATSLNDSLRMSFAEIADLIEKEYLRDAE